MATGKELRSLKGFDAEFYAIAFSPDSKLLVGGGDHHEAVRIWEVATGEEQCTLKGHISPVTSVIFSPDGKTLATGSGDGTAKLWDVATGEERRTLPFKGHWAGKVCLAFSSDGKTLASSAQDGMVRLWDPDARPGSPLLSKSIILHPPGGVIHQLTLSPDGRHLVTLNGNQTVYVLRLAPSPSPGK